MAVLDFTQQGTDPDVQAFQSIFRPRQGTSLRQRTIRQSSEPARSEAKGGAALRQQSAGAGTRCDARRARGVFCSRRNCASDGAGRVTGDRKLENEGKVDQVKGAVHSGVGRAQDAVNDTFRRT